MRKKSNEKWLKVAEACCLLRKEHLDGKRKKHIRKIKLDDAEHRNK